MSGDLIKVGAKVAGVGGEIAVGEGFPTALARLIPGSLKREVRRGVTAAILKKLETGGIDRADADYADEMFGEAEAVYFRRKEIAMRAAQVVAADPTLALPPKPADGDAEPTPDAGATADEWVRRFWDDAGAVSDDVLKEIYARLLAGESRTPGSCSMRTLRALRYLDRSAADNFATALSCVIDNRFLPADMGDLTFSALHDLNDAGLVDFRKDVGKVFPNPGPFTFSWGVRIFELRFEPFNEREKPDLPIYLLQNAGRELARVANVKRDSDFGERFAFRLVAIPNAHVRIADMPSLDWEGSGSDLAWTEVAKVT